MLARQESLGVPSPASSPFEAVKITKENFEISGRLIAIKSKDHNGHKNTPSV